MCITIDSSAPVLIYHGQSPEFRFQTSSKGCHAVLTYNDLKVSASFRPSLSRIYAISLTETSMLNTCAVDAFTPFRCSSAMLCSCHDPEVKNFQLWPHLGPNTDEFIRTAESAFSRLFDQSSQMFYLVSPGVSIRWITLERLPTCSADARVWTLVIDIDLGKAIVVKRSAERGKTFIVFCSVKQSPIRVYSPITSGITLNSVELTEGACIVDDTTSSTIYGINPSW